MRFPSIKSVSDHLRAINANVEEECDVRLCVWEDGEWCVRWGLSDYDQSHSPYCGASAVPGNERRFRSKDVAKDLIEQVKEQRAMDVA